MFIAYDESGTHQLMPGYGLGYWLDPNIWFVYIACNVSVWIVPGTVLPED